MILCADSPRWGDARSSAFPEYRPRQHYGVDQAHRGTARAATDRHRARRASASSASRSPGCGRRPSRASTRTSSRPSTTSRTASRTSRTPSTRSDRSGRSSAWRSSLVLLKKVPVALHVAIAGVLAWGVGELLHEILDPQSIHGPRRQHPHRRRADLPLHQRRGHHRVGPRARAVRRAAAPPGVPAPRDPGRALGDVPGHRVPLRRRRRHLPRVRGRRAGARRVRRAGRAADAGGGARRARRARVRRGRRDACRRAGRTRRGDGRAPDVGRAAARRRVRPRPARRPGRGEGLALDHVPRSRGAGVRQSPPADRAHRVRADARRASGCPRTASREDRAPPARRRRCS